MKYQIFLKGLINMLILKILSLIIIGFWLVSTFAATIKDEEKTSRITTFIMFLLTIIPFYYIYMR